MSEAPRAVPMVQDIQVQGAAGPLPARIYGERRAGGAAPMILYFHGGGWVIADLDTYDSSARALAAETGAIVVSSTTARRRSTASRRRMRMPSRPTSGWWRTAAPSAATRTASPSPARAPAATWR